MARSKKADTTTADVLAAAAAAQAAQAKAPAAPQPSFWEVRALLSDRCSEGQRRKAYFKFHPVAQYADRMDVAAWLGALHSQHADRLS